MKLSFGMEFQTSNFNIMIKKEDDTIYYPPSRMNIDLSGDDSYPVIEMTGDRCTSQMIKDFTEQDFLKKWMDQSPTILQLSLELQKQQVFQQKIKIPVQDDIIQIFNDAEFLVTLGIDEDSKCERVSLLNGIIERLKLGATELEKTLMEKTTKLRVATLKLLSAQSSQIRPLSLQEFPYQAGYTLKDIEDKTYFLMSHQKQMTLSRARFYTQITMCVSLADIIKVLAILTDECKRCADHLDPEDAVQLEIFPQIITRLSVMIGIKPIKDNPIVYSMLVLFMYSFKTRANRKAAPFIIRHIMIDLLRLLQPEQLVLLRRWIELYGAPEFRGYSERIFYNLRQQDEKKVSSEMWEYQNLYESTIFKIKDQLICFEFRYIYALLEKLSGGDRLLTFAQLKSLPQIGKRARPSSFTQTQTFF